MEDRIRQKSNIFFRLVESFLLSIFYFTKLLSRFLPPAALTILFDSFGTIVFYARPGMRRRLEDKISDAMPEITDRREIAQIGRQACGAAIRPILDLVLFWRYGDRIMRDMTIEGMEYLDKADAEGKGVIMITAHIGSFDLIMVSMARLERYLTPIMFHPSTTPVPRYYITLTIFGQTLGCDHDNPVFWTGLDTVRKGREHIAKGKRLGIAFDVDGHCVVELFGRPAALADGIAHFALDTGAPVVPLCLLRGRKALDRRLKFYEPLEYSLTGDRSNDVKIIMREVAKAGEKQIREAPEQWMSWFGLWQWWEIAEELEGRKG